MAKKTPCTENPVLYQRCILKVLNSQSDWTDKEIQSEVTLLFEYILGLKENNGTDKGLIQVIKEFDIFTYKQSINF